MNIDPYDKQFFGGNRTRALKRDDYRCVSCGMTNARHIIRFGKMITVDHIDGMGSNSPRKLRNNNLNNLQTLCFPCHGRKDNQTRRLTENDVIEIRSLIEFGFDRKLISNLYKIDITTLHGIIHRLTWSNI